MTVLPADRGARQRLKILQLLAAVEADGRTPLDEALLTGLTRLRRGMTAIVITASQDPSFVRPLAALRARGIGAVVISLDAPAYEPAPDEAAADVGPEAGARPPPHARRVPDPHLHGRPPPAARRGPGAMIERLEVRRPAEGWITLLLMLALGFILAWAIDDPAWVNGHGELTDFLATCAIAGVLIGFAGPKLGWGRWTTHLIGATFAALVIPILAGQAALARRVDRPGLPLHRRGLGQRVPRPRLARAEPHEPGDPLLAGDRDHRVGDDAVRVVRGLRAPAAAGRGRRDRPRAAP